MAKFKMKMKLEGFELELEGEREDIPLMAQNVSQQLVGLIEPAANIAADKAPKKMVASQQGSSQSNSETTTKKKSSRGSSKSAKEPPVDWAHDSGTWGSPCQEWNPLKKSIWLLYVVSNVTEKNQLTAGCIASTFNKHFKSSGMIRGSNVSRDLGKAKAERLSPVGQDTVGNNEFFLTDKGKELAVQLVAEARGETAPADSGLYEE